MRERHEQIDTEVIHLAEGQDPLAAPLTRPLYKTSTYLFESAAEVEAYANGRSSKFLYTRYGNPTITAAETKLAALEGGEAALVFASGMAAVATTMMALVRAGDEIVVPAGLYGGTVHLLHDLLANFGVTARAVTLAEMHEPERVLGANTRLLWFESPVNPVLQCLDIARVAAACRARGIPSVIDNTFASPVNQRPLSLGVDLVMHSATKYLAGHSDLTAGAIVGPRGLVGRIEGVRRLLGTILDPQPAYDLARSLKTLSLRVARHNENALAVAQALEHEPGCRVLYPGLPSHPDHAIAAKQMSGFGGMVCLDLAGSYERACRAFDRLRVFKRAASLGGVESLCSLPVLTSQAGYSDEQLARAGVTRGMMRLSVGLEDARDLIADLRQAIA